MNTKVQQVGSRFTRPSRVAALFVAGILLASCGDRHGQGGGNPVQPGQAQEVHLIWNAGLNKWMVKLNNGQEQNPSSATITLPEGTGPTMFTVDIAGKQAAFKETGGLTVWEESKSKPQGSTQILGPVITKQGKMVFYDLNQGAAVKIYYGLNLDNGESIDPIIDNRGGGNI